MVDDRTCRYFVTDKRGLTLWHVAYGVRNHHPGFRFGDLYEPDQASCHMGLRGERLAKITVRGRGDPAFSVEVEVARDFLGTGRGGGGYEADLAVVAAQHVLVVELLKDGLNDETPGGPLQPLWSWLLDHREGVLLAGVCGFFMGRVPSEEDEGNGDPTH